MTHSLLVALVFAKLGTWGEDPHVVPDFALAQERRASEVPAGDALFAAHERRVEDARLDHGLLVCHVQVSAAAGRCSGSGRT